MALEDPLSPAAIRSRTGRRPFLIVAPHGGRREVARRPWSAGSLRVNDLHTAELAADLAEHLDADALINTTIDRNDLDLNRVAQIRSRAPWFLDLIAARLERMQQEHERLTVLFVHGWNVVNPACDCGLGVSPSKRTPVSPGGAIGATRQPAQPPVNQEPATSQPATPAYVAPLPLSTTPTVRTRITRSSRKLCLRM